MERVTKKKAIKVSGEFVPTVKVGTAIKPGDLLGTTKVTSVLEVHNAENGHILVDDGVYVLVDTPLVEYRHGFRKEIAKAAHEGIIKVTKQAVSIVAEHTIEDVKATTWGRVLSVSESSYLLEVKYLKIPIFVSKGFALEAPLYCLLNKGVVVAPHHIPEEVAGKVVLLPGALSKETHKEILDRGALGVLAPSIDWVDYLEVFKAENTNTGILHGFGMFPLWRWYYHLLSKMHEVVVEVDFATSSLHIPISDILMGSLEQDLMLFKEYWWGKQVKELQHVSGDFIATLETGEQTPVVAEELFNIR